MFEQPRGKASERGSGITHDSILSRQPSGARNQVHVRSRRRPDSSVSQGRVLSVCPSPVHVSPRHRVPSWPPGSCSCASHSSFATDGYQRSGSRREACSCERCSVGIRRVRIATCLARGVSSDNRTCNRDVRCRDRDLVSVPTTDDGGLHGHPDGEPRDNPTSAAPASPREPRQRQEPSFDQRRSS
jgi:hypothetical protein